MIACGLSFMFGVMRIINLAHGSLAIVAAFGLWFIADRLEYDPFLALIVVLPGMGLLGWLLQRGILERSARSGELVPILSTFGLAIVVENALFEFFGADTRSLAPYVGSLSYDSFELGGGLYIGELAILTFAVAILLLGGLQLFLTYTPARAPNSGDSRRPGHCRARRRQLPVCERRRRPSIALVTVALAGLFLGLRSNFDPYSGSLQLIFAFEAAVIGGTGSLWGTLRGGIVLGVAQTFGAHLHPQGFLLAGHAVFLLVLVGRLYVPAQLLRVSSNQQSGRFGERSIQDLDSALDESVDRRRHYSRPCARPAVGRSGLHAGYDARQADGAVHLYIAGCDVECARRVRRDDLGGAASVLRNSADISLSDFPNGASNPIWRSSLPHCWRASWRCPSPQLCCGFAPASSRSGCG